VVLFLVIIPVLNILNDDGITVSNAAQSPTLLSMVVVLLGIPCSTSREINMNDRFHMCGSCVLFYLQWLYFIIISSCGSGGNLYFGFDYFSGYFPPPNKYLGVGCSFVIHPF
jgi:hypothetical protein